ncbi:uncharacterized protein LOC143429263 [Xylocopa sonorina]|uniref:uncharacterized protein LOC143429263 n=1 Tax=Xylocopa sonorina TaxID=1818115 RepID=UPI00403AB1D7
MDNKLKIILWNCRSINNKISEVKLLANTTDIFIITETWLKPEQPLHIKGFQTVRSNRISARGGGIAFLLRNHIRYNILDNHLQDTETNTIIVEITSLPQLLVIAGCYRPPDHILRYQT